MSKSMNYDRLEEIRSMTDDPDFHQSPSETQQVLLELIEWIDDILGKILKAGREMVKSNEMLFEESMMRSVIKILVHHMAVEEDLRAILDVIGINADHGISVEDQINHLKRIFSQDPRWTWWDI